MRGVLVKVTVAVINTMAKSNLEKKGFIRVTLLYRYSTLKEIRTGTQKDRNLEAGADAEAMKGAAYWLAPRGLLSQLSYSVQNYLAQVWLYPQWAGTSHINH